MLLDFNTIVKKYNLNIDGIIHIGAHYGQEINLYIENNIKNIICFEPLLNNFLVLEKMQQTNVNYLILPQEMKIKKIKMYVDTTNDGQSIHNL